MSIYKLFGMATAGLLSMTTSVLPIFHIDVINNSIYPVKVTVRVRLLDDIVRDCPPGTMEDGKIIPSVTVINHELRILRAFDVTIDPGNKHKKEAWRPISLGSSFSENWHLTIDPSGDVNKIEVGKYKAESIGSIAAKLIEPIESLARDIAGGIFNTAPDYFKEHPYANKEALIRQSFGLCSDEQEAIANRSIKAKKALEILLKTTLSDKTVPRIAICMSGGGVRAATCSYGLLAGLDKINLLNAITYAAGLSGSTFLLCGFLEYGKSITEYKNIFLQAVTKDNIAQPDASLDTFLQKYLHKQPINIVDPFGIYLSNKFFRDLPTDMDRQRIWFSTLSNRVKDGSFMFPLCTAVEISKPEKGKIWFTFSPYETGSDELGSYLPIWALGRKFNNGISIKNDKIPELRLGFLMALWGSFLSGTFKQLYEIELKKSMNDPNIRLVTEKILDIVGNLQVAPVNISNPFYGIAKSIYKDLELLTFEDAGYDYNLPFGPLLNKERSVDIIIAIDSSGTVHKDEGVELRKAEQDARKKGMSFPKINYTNITKKAVNVFSDTDPKTPIVIYIVPTKNVRHPELGDPEKEFATTYKTLNFTFSEYDAKRLIDIICYNIDDNKELIINAIKQKINQKKMLPNN